MSNSTKPIRKIDAEIEYDPEATMQALKEPLSGPPKEPSIADYLPMIYIAIAILIGAFLAVKLYKGAKKKVKPFKVEVKASVSVTKPDSEELDEKD
jgi:hypothetical protein